MTSKVAMYLGSMDHSPSEQLGEPGDWHTTVLVLSEGGEHWKFATDLAETTKCKNSTLVRWSNRRTKRRLAYAKQFEDALVNRLGSYPVHVHAISAQAETINASLEHILSQLGLSKLVQSYEKKGKAYLNFGPFQRVKVVSDGQGVLKKQIEPANFELPERQGLSIMYICHFALRVHQRLVEILKPSRPDLEWVDWQMMPNKFPGDINGPMGALFHAVMSGAASQKLVAGDIRVATFNESEHDRGSILADNIAGLISDKLLVGEFELRQMESAEECCSLCWEVWNPTKDNAVSS